MIDLVDLSMLPYANDNYKYLLMCIDVLSKFGYCEPIKFKSANAVCTAFENILARAAPVYQCIHTVTTVRSLQMRCFKKC